MSISEMAYTRGARDAQMKFAGLPPAGAPGSVVAPPPAGVPASGGAPNMTPAKAPNASITPVTGLPGVPTAAGAGRTNQQSSIMTGAAPAAATPPIASSGAAGPK